MKREQPTAKHMQVALALFRSTGDSLGRSFVALGMALAFSMCMAEVVSSWTIVGCQHFLGFPSDDWHWVGMFAVGVPAAMLFQPGFIGMSVLSAYRMGCSFADFFAEFEHTPMYLLASVIYFVMVFVGTCVTGDERWRQSGEHEAACNNEY